MNKETRGDGRSLIGAAMHGDWEGVRKALSDGEDTNQRDASGRTALMRAAVRKDPMEGVKLLVPVSDVTAVDDSGKCALVLAMMKGNEEVANFLIKHGDPNQRHIGATTPLMWAARKGFEQVVRGLLDMDSTRADLVDEENRSALHHAVDEGNVEIVKMLLPTSNLMLKAKNGYNPLQLAATAKNLDCLSFLLPHYDDEACVEAIESAREWRRKECIGLIEEFLRARKEFRALDSECPKGNGSLTRKKI